MHMPIRQRIWTGVLLLGTLSSVTACDDDKEQAAKLAEVQRIADEKLKKAQKEADDKVAAMQKQLDQMKADAEAQAAKLKSEADQAIAKAQGDVEEQSRGRRAEESACGLQGRGLATARTAEQASAGSRAEDSQSVRQGETCRAKVDEGHRDGAAGHRQRSGGVRQGGAR